MTSDDRNISNNYYVGNLKFNKYGKSFKVTERFVSCDTQPFVLCIKYITVQCVNGQRRRNGLVIYKVPFEILDGSWLRNKSLWTSLKIYGGDVDPFVASVTRSHSGFFLSAVRA